VEPANTRYQYRTTSAGYLYQLGFLAAEDTGIGWVGIIFGDGMEQTFIDSTGGTNEFT
jgi:hypothetical protein